MKRDPISRIARIIPRIVVRAAFVSVVPICTAIVPSLACVPGFDDGDAGEDGGDGGADGGDAQGDGASPVDGGDSGARD